MPPQSDPNDATVIHDPSTTPINQTTIRARDNLIGITLGGRYLIEQELARGGMGAVYLARDKPEMLSRRVVIKVLLEDSLKDEWVVKKFRQEIESLTRLDDPGVVGIFDAGTLGDGSPYLVMQYVDGANLRTALKPNERTGGGSDDIGDVSWNVPTVTLRFPSNIPGLPGHNWANAISMATPIAHKGATAGAKVMAMTILDLLMRPELVSQAWDYFRTVQTKDIKYQPLIRPQDRPAIELNRDVMARFRPQMRRYYYDPSKYRTYLEQLGITYPTERAADGSCTGGATP